MKVFDLARMTAYPYEQRERNVFYQVGEFKARIIELPPGGRMPDCDMASHVIFCVLEGQAQVWVNGRELTLQQNHCLVTEPATLSMTSEQGVRMLGIQVAKD